jgi:hypothetical protein
VLLLAVTAGTTGASEWLNRAARLPFPAQRETAPEPPPRGAPMSAEAALELVRSTGLQSPSLVRQRGAHMVIDAQGRGGEMVRMVVDGHSGEIVGFRPLRARDEAAPR